MKRFLFPALAVVLAISCGQDAMTLSGLDPADFKTEIDGKETGLYTLTNAAGMEVCITNFGGRIVSVMVPDRNGKMQDVVLGFDNINDYINVPSDFGATIGRYANRINKGRIVLDGTEYQLPQNNYGHCLHGGPKGFQYRVFDVKSISDSQIEMSYLAEDGEEGFPGNLRCTVTMSLTDDNAIDIRYSAVTDKTTIVNMTNHSYFNLDGNPAHDNSDWLLSINADGFTPVDSTFMTTGEILSVEGTPMDFRNPVRIGDRINSGFIQMKNGNGIDHNWVLNTSGDISTACASLKSPETGIRLDVFTTEPGIQVYCGNFLDGTVTGKHDMPYNFRTAVCLETQKYPDTPNKKEWPSAELRPGEKYTSRCIYRFSVDQ